MEDRDGHIKRCLLAVRRELNNLRSSGDELLTVNYCYEMISDCLDLIDEPEM